MPEENIVEPEVIEQNGEPTPEDNGLDGEAELLAALKSLNAQEDPEDEEDEEVELEDKEDDIVEDQEDDEEDPEEDPVVEDKPKKQSKEDNAKFAAQRREQQLQAKVQEELERLKQESPEFKLAKQLAEMYGTTPEELVVQMQEANLQKEATEKNVPIELLRERQAEKQRLEQVETELNQLRYQSWKNSIEAEGQKLQTEYPMLNQEDMDAAVNYILQTAQNVDMPLEQAVYALHGKKIIDGLAKAKQQDNLATESGRKKKVPLAPNNGKTSQTKSVTAEEKYIAKQLGMSVDDYLKYK